MCELLGMSARYPADLNTSIRLFRPRGGETGPHGDGWGLAFFEGRTARTFKEAVPAYESRYLDFLQNYGLQSQMVIAHLRKANPPGIGCNYANTHPFEREVGGRAWVFAHNGIVPGIENFELGRYSPMGDSDSEWAFCLIMERIQKCISQSGRLGDVDHTLSCLEPVISAVNPLDEFNFLLGNGEHLFVHAHSLLHLLTRTCRCQGCDQQVIMVATEPLSDEPWLGLLPNTFLVLKDGEVIHEARTQGPASVQAWRRRQPDRQVKTTAAVKERRAE